MKARTALLLSVLALALAGCRGWQSALDPQGPQARELAWLFWIFTAVLAAIWVAVMVALAVALLRRGPPRPAPRRPARGRPGTRAAYQLRRCRARGCDRRDGAGADRVQLRLAAQPLPGRGGGGHDPRHGKPVVVGHPLRGGGREPQLHD